MEAKRIFRLLSAIRGNNPDEVKQLLDEGLDPDTKFYLSGRYRPAVSLAAEERSAEIGNLKKIKLWSTISNEREPKSALC
jgi:hypothetical protein